MKRKLGDFVDIEYKGKLSSGEIVDNNGPGKTMHVVLGDRSVPLGLESALFDMEVGEEREITLTPDIGFGQYEPEACFEVPKSMLPEWTQLPVGEYIKWRGNNKNNLRAAIAKVVEIADDHVVIDLNHPLAGKTITYWVKVISEGTE